MLFFGKIEVKLIEQELEQGLYPVMCLVYYLTLFTACAPHAFRNTLAPTDPNHVHDINLCADICDI